MHYSLILCSLAEQSARAYGIETVSRFPRDGGFLSGILLIIHGSGLTGDVHPDTQF